MCAHRYNGLDEPEAALGALGAGGGLGGGGGAGGSQLRNVGFTLGDEPPDDKLAPLIRSRSSSK